MKHTVTAGLFTLVAAFAYSSVASAADALTGCAAKRAEIEYQIGYAKAHNNVHQVAGLQAALDETVRNCTDDGLLRQRQAKVAEKQSKVAEREHELQNARETGSQKKIKQKEKKLASAKEELAEAQQALSH
ncbi:DUF1090 domain-containing protein [Serratia sp. AKBS12]|uniref:DUF1090 domain-containing protein n=1 Tax=Serratia sp. AKBS12 TaxID=2974597 RepID=UPI002165FF68|nr:DUF1090 domain-containing protein [Serratia sp. AKBS12]MCS3406711.1 DUF1090 domain-containing protein [Serratia sp. AKBS12]HEI8868028.1 DUF1090 domain-containing protein [Serratia odorifera]